MLTPSEIWSKIKIELDDTTEGGFSCTEDIDSLAVGLIAANTISDVVHLGQAKDPQINFHLDQKTDGTPLLVAVSYSIKKPDDGKVKITPDRALIVRYLNGSAHIYSAKVP